MSSSRSEPCEANSGSNFGRPSLQTSALPKVTFGVAPQTYPSLMVGAGRFGAQRLGRVVLSAVRFRKRRQLRRAVEPRGPAGRLKELSRRSLTVERLLRLRASGSSIAGHQLAPQSMLGAAGTFPPLPMAALRSGACRNAARNYETRSGRKATRIRKLSRPLLLRPGVRRPRFVRGVATQSCVADTGFHI